jgi:hypothetical protein
MEEVGAGLTVAGPSKRPTGVEREPTAETTEAEGSAEAAVVEVELPEVVCGQ